MTTDECRLRLTVRLMCRTLRGSVRGPVRQLTALSCRLRCIPTSDIRHPAPGIRHPMDDPVRLPIEAVLDLHAFHPRDVRSVVEEYVTAAHDAGLREIRLVHGRGTGVQRGIVQAALERHPLVVRFWDAPESHLGATVARLCAQEDAEG